MQRSLRPRRSAPRSHTPKNGRLRALLGCLVTLLTTALPVLRAQRGGAEVGFVETFALAENRAEVLSRLTPGTDEARFFRCLERQHAGDLDAVDAILEEWSLDRGAEHLLNRIEFRQMLLRYGERPDRVRQELVRFLGLTFDDDRPRDRAAPDLPTRLDPATISREALTERAFELHPRSLDGFAPHALGRIATPSLDETRRAALLERIETPDVPGLPELVVADLARSSLFGNRKAHGLLTLEQLERCAQLRPDLLGNDRFVKEWLARLEPGLDEDIEGDLEARGRYLERLAAFVDRLGARFNSLEANVLHHRIRLDLALGTVDERRLRTYLALPRRTGYVRPSVYEQAGGALVQPGEAFAHGLPAIGDDEELVRECLLQVFARANDPSPWTRFLREEWVRKTFVEAKVLAGVGDPAAWLRRIEDADWIDALRARTEIRFPRPHPTHYAPEDTVVVDVESKNVEKLLVKVFEIDTYNYCTTTGNEVDASIDLDGLVANRQRTVELAPDPLRRQRRRLEFPEMRGRGVWIVELLGNGIASRVVVRKGALTTAVRSSAAGQAVTVFDEAGRMLRDAVVHFAGRAFTAGESGEILIPYSTDGGTKTLVVQQGGFATAVPFAHRTETYALVAPAVVDREALLAGRSARIVVRPRLTLNGATVDPALLEDPVLQIRSTDRLGTVSTVDVRGDALRKAGGVALGNDLVHEIRVPEDVTRLDVTLSGIVESLSTGAEVALSGTTWTFDFDRIDATAAVASPVLGRSPEGYSIDLLGKDGEPLAARALTVKLSFHDFTDPLPLRMRTDDEGRIRLGPLDGVASVATDFEPELGAWFLAEADVSLPDRMDVRFGDEVALPWPDRASRPERGEVSFLRTARRGGTTYVEDAFGDLEVGGRFLRIRPSAPGRYLLRLARHALSTTVDVADGEARGAWIETPTRLVRARDPREFALHVEAVDPGDADGDVTIRLANADPTTRVHVVATRYLPPFGLDRLMLGVARTLDHAVGRPSDDATTYHAGRTIGDEYRYILERRAAPKFIGNMLPRPGLLLNPWALEETSTRLVRDGFEGESWNQSVGLGGGAGGAFGGSRGRRRSGASPGTFTNFAFLPTGSRLVANLEPDDDGVVRVARAALGDGSTLHVLAVSGVGGESYATATVAETPLQPASRALARGLDPSTPYAEQRRIESVPADGNAVVDDVRTAKVATIDSLASVHALYRTLTGNDDLARFRFVLEWPGLTPERKLALYSEHACHELNLFVYFKDRAFFDEFVAPYLANKVHRTFVDEWLLGVDLAGYLDPWRFAQLNTFEQVLLARRIGGEAGAKLLGRIDDLVALQDRDPSRQSALFSTVLGTARLDVSDESLGRKLEKAPERLRSKKGQEEGGADRRATRTVFRLGRPANEQDAGDAAPDPSEPSQDAAPGAPAEDSKESAFDSSAWSALEGRLAEDLGRRASVRGFFRDVAATQRYVESDYWHVPVEDATPALVSPNRFWRDWALAPTDRPFVTVHITDAATTFASMMLALAVLDLPFVAGEQTTDLDGTRMTLRPSKPLLLVRREVREAEVEDQAPILVSQNVFRLDRRYTVVDGKRVDAWVTGEFLAGVAYGCQVVVTNPTSTPRPIDVLLQIPRGAIPVRGSLPTRSVAMTVPAYSTQALDHAFYFPRTGEYPHYPVHVSDSFSGRVLGAADPLRFDVVAEPTEVETGTWESFAFRAETDALVEHLGTANLAAVDLGDLAWRMADQDAFDRIVTVLRARQAYEGSLWRYGFVHGDERAMREYLRHQDAVLRIAGPAIRSDLVSTDPVERKWYQHVEFRPLVNARAHRFGDSHRILNESLAGQYLAFLEVLAHRTELDAIDRLGVTYYLMLQDRIAEALEAFAKVDRAELVRGGVGAIQYDAVAAWLAFPQGDATRARTIASRYADHPIPRWQDLFREMLRQLDEAEGIRVDDPDTAALPPDLDATEPALEMELQGREVTVTFANLATCEVRYFLMDVEFSFSNAPFSGDGTEAFAFVRPNRTDRVDLQGSGSEVSFEVPAAFDGRNVLVEVRAAGIVRREPAYANDLTVRWIENRGQLRVGDPTTDRALPRVYVKVFRRDGGGRVTFHKDGYTDLRGRFDYASLSGSSTDTIARFAVLVLSEERGAVIRELDPPSR